MHDSFVGVIEGPVPDTVVLGVVGIDRDVGPSGIPAGNVTGQVFHVARAHLDDYYVRQPDGRNRFERSPDLDPIDAFLGQHIAKGARSRFLIEAPETTPLPRDHSGIPHPIFEIDSGILRVLTLLGVRGYVAAPLAVSPDRRLAIGRPIARAGEMAHLHRMAPLYLPRGISRAYAEMLSVPGEQPEYVAIVGG